MMKKLNNDQQQYAMVSPETIPSVIITASQDPQRVGVTNYRAYMPSALEDYQPLVPLLDTLDELATVAGLLHRAAPDRLDDPLRQPPLALTEQIAAIHHGHAVACAGRGDRRTP